LRLLRVYRQLFAAAVKNAAQYRAQILLWTIGGVMRPLVFLAAWTAVAAAQGGSVGGFTTGEFAAYYVGVIVVGVITNAWNSWEFDFEVREGTLSPKLLRPLHPIHYSVAATVVQKAIMLLGLLPAVWLVTLTFHPDFHTQWWHLLLFVPSVVLGAAINFFMDWTFATAAFWTSRTHSISELSDRFALVFAGRIAPTALLPGVLQPLGWILPYAYVLSVPAEILRGGTTLEQSLLLMLGQLAWATVMYAVLQLCWRVGVRQYGAVGA
jgi:ABC-2 type transport system permease protein